MGRPAGQRTNRRMVLVSTERWARDGESADLTGASREAGWATLNQEAVTRDWRGQLKSRSHCSRVNLASTELARLTSSRGADRAGE